MTALDPLALQLHAQLEETHRRFGCAPEPLAALLQYDDVELHAVSANGVLAFVGDYVLAAWPDDELPAAAPAAYRHLSARLKQRGFTLHMVHPMNFRSVKLTRKMGAKPLGVDDEGFMHYRLESADFPHHDD